MKIIHWLTSRSGKLALSTLQMVAGAGVIGVAGVAAYQIFSSPAVNPDTMVTYQDDDVVYVAGAAGGSYSSNIGYGEGGEVQSGIKVSSRNIKLTEKMEQEDMIRVSEKPQQTQLDRDEEQVKAFKMDGASTGLGLKGQDKGTEVFGGQGDMGGVQSQIAAISAMADQQTAAAAAQAQAAAAGGDIAQAAAQAAALQRGGKGWGNMNSSIARANGNNLNSDPLQKGPVGSKRGGTLGGANGQEGDRLAMADRANLGKSDGFTNSRDEFLKARRMGKYSNDLAGMEKQSADLVGRKNLATNDAASVFMSSGQGGGGITLNKDALASGGTASSVDAVDNPIKAMSGFNVGDEEGETYAEGKQRLVEDIKKFRTELQGISWLPDGIKQIVYLFMMIRRDKLVDKIDEFKETWGESLMETEGTQGAFSEHATDCTYDLYAAAGNGMLPLVIGSIAGTASLAVIYDKYKDQYWADTEDDDDDDDDDK